MPGHFLFGATHLHKHGVDVIIHQHRAFKNKFRLALYTLMEIFSCREEIDAIYATSQAGLELVMLLRALRIMRHPVILWQKEPLTSGSLWDRLLLKGVDYMLFYSNAIMDVSVRNGLANPAKSQVVHWGADLDFYDKIMFSAGNVEHKGYISTGKEKRDMASIVRAFSATGQPLEIHVAYKAYGDNYLQILNDLRPSSNVHVNFVNGMIPGELAQKVWTAKCVVIALQETNYATGLTTLIEAMALGLPVMCTKNPNLPIDVEEEGIGVSLPYYNSDAWEAVIRDFAEHPERLTEMGKKSRLLADLRYNLDNCTKELAKVFMQFR